MRPLTQDGKSRLPRSLNYNREGRISAKNVDTNFRKSGINSYYSSSKDAAQVNTGG